MKQVDYAANPIFRALRYTPPQLKVLGGVTHIQAVRSDAWPLLGFKMYRADKFRYVYARILTCKFRPEGGPN